VLEEGAESGLRIGDRVLNGVEIGLDFRDEMGEGAAMLRGERIEQGQRLLLKGAAARCDLSEVMYKLAGERIGGKAQLREFGAQPGLQLHDLLRFSVAHGTRTSLLITRQSRSLGG